MDQNIVLKHIIHFMKIYFTSPLFINYFFIVLRWFCHVDDDNYVNVPALGELLKMYNPIGDWYLGRTSTPKPLQIRSKSQVCFLLCNNTINVSITFELSYKNLQE